MRRLRPLKAIRKYCVSWCCNGKSDEVDLCSPINCSLYKFRLGKGRGHKLRAIRLKCLDCSAGSFEEVKDCPFEDCRLFPYRFGKNPALKGMVRGASRFPKRMAILGG